MGNNYTEPLCICWYLHVHVYTCTYFSKPLRLLYSLIIYEIMNFFLRSLLFATSFFLSISVPIYVIVHVHVYTGIALSTAYCNYIHVQSHYRLSEVKAM